MDYENLWKEFKIRLFNAREFGVTPVVSIHDIIKLLEAYEQHFEALAKEEDELSKMNLAKV